MPLKNNGPDKLWAHFVADFRPTISDLSYGRKMNGQPSPIMMDVTSAANSKITTTKIYLRQELCSVAAVIFVFVVQLPDKEKS